MKQILLILFTLLPVSMMAQVKAGDTVRGEVTSDDNVDGMSIIYAFCQFVDIKSEAEPSAIRDPRDLYLLSLAETIGADYIVSGDADLTDLKLHKQTKIIKLADFKSLMQYA